MTTVTKVKDHPITFTTELIPKILDGTKTQTRRVIKPCSTATLHDGSQPDWVFTLAKCPYGQVGDRLWVRERYCRECFNKDGIEDGCYPFDADPPYAINDCKEAKWQSPLFMPHWASRITLEITALRVERLQETGQTDISREGIELQKMKPNEDWEHHIHVNRMNFMRIWDSINAKRGYPWESNPWVWVIEFVIAQKGYNGQ